MFKCGLVAFKIRIIALDFIGHGYSSHLAPGLFYSPNSFIMDVERVADYFDWENFTIIGEYMVQSPYYG